MVPYEPGKQFFGKQGFKCLRVDKYLQVPGDVGSSQYARGSWEEYGKYCKESLVLEIGVEVSYKCITYMYYTHTIHKLC